MSRRVICLLLIGLFVVALVPAHPAPVKPAGPAPVKPGDASPTDALGDPLPEGALARIGSNRLRHTNWAITAAYSPDGKIIASCGNDSLIRLWDATTGKQLRQIAGHANWINCVAFSPDGKRLVSGSHDRSVRVWDAESGKELLNLNAHQGMVRVCLFSPDGKIIASAANDGLLKLWDAETGQMLRQIVDHTSQGTSNVIFTPNGKQVVSVAQDFSLKVSETATGKELKSLEGHTADVESLGITADGKTLVSSGHDESIRVWDLASGKETMKLLGHTDAVATVRITSDGKTIASGGADRTIRFWDIATGNAIHKIDAHSNMVSEVNFSPDNKVLVSASWDNTIRLWDVKTGKPLPGLEKIGDLVQSLALSPDGKVLATAGTGDRIRLWEPTTGKLLERSLIDEAKVTALAFAPGGKLLASANEGCGPQGTIALWDLATDKVLRRIEGTAMVRTLGFTADGKLIVGAADDGSVRRWDTGTGKEVGQPVATGGGSNPVFRGQISNGPGLAVSPDGQTMAVAGLDNSLQLFDVRTGEQRRLWQLASRTTQLSFAGDGRTLAGARLDGTVQLWEVATGLERAIFSGLGPMPGVNPVQMGFPAALSADGRFLASADARKGVRVFDLASMKELPALAGHEGMVTRLSFSRDGRFLVSTAQDGTAMVWDAAGFAGGKGPGAELSAERLTALWDDLAESVGAKAFQAVWELADSDRGVQFLSDRLAPAKAAADTETIAKLVAVLDDDTFAVREKAAHDLEKLGVEAESALKKMLVNPPSLNARRTAERLLDKLNKGEMTPEARRMLRAVEVLERAGTPQARKLIQALADGTPEALLTREARAAQARLGKAE